MHHVNSVTGWNQKENVQVHALPPWTTHLARPVLLVCDYGMLSRAHGRHDHKHKHDARGDQAKAHSVQRDFGPDLGLVSEAQETDCSAEEACYCLRSWHAQRQSDQAQKNALQRRHSDDLDHGRPAAAQHGDLVTPLGSHHVSNQTNKGQRHAQNWDTVSVQK